MADLDREKRLIAEKHAFGVAHTDVNLTPEQEPFPVPSKALTDLESMGGEIVQPSGEPLISPVPVSPQLKLPTWGFWNNLNLDQSILFSTVTDATVQHLGMDVLYRGSGSFAADGEVFTDAGGPGGDDYSTVGVASNDLMYVVDGSDGTSGEVFRILSVGTPTTLNLFTLFSGGKLAPASATISNYYIFRPAPVRMATLPGSGPLGREQVFLSVVPDGLRRSLSELDDLSVDGSGGNPYTAHVPRCTGGPFLADGTSSPVGGGATASDPFTGTFTSAGAHTFVAGDTGRFICAAQGFVFEITGLISPTMVDIQAHNEFGVAGLSGVDWFFADNVTTLIHDKDVPDLADINAARVFPLVSPQDAERSRLSQNFKIDEITGTALLPPVLTGDAADSFFREGSIGDIGFRAVFYPVKDDGGGNPVPDLDNPILDTNPLIDGGVPQDQQQTFFDYSTGILRLSDPPIVGDGLGGPGDSRTDGAFNPNGIAPGDLAGNTTDRLPLYMVAWMWKGHKGAGAAAGLKPRTQEGLPLATLDYDPALRRWDLDPAVLNAFEVLHDESFSWDFTVFSEELVLTQITEVALAEAPALTDMGVAVGDYLQVTGQSAKNHRYRIIELVDDTNFKVLNQGGLGLADLSSPFKAIFLRQTTGVSHDIGVNLDSASNTQPGTPSSRLLPDRVVSEIEYRVSTVGAGPDAFDEGGSATDDFVAPSLTVRNRLTRQSDGGLKTFVDLDIRHRSTSGRDFTTAGDKDWFHVSSNALFLRHASWSQTGNALDFVIDAASGGTRVSDADFGAKVGDFVHLLDVDVGDGTLTDSEGPFLITGVAGDTVTVHRTTSETATSAVDGIIVVERRDDTQRTPLLRGNQYGDLEVPGALEVLGDLEAGGSIGAALAASVNTAADDHPLSAETHTLVIHPTLMHSASGTLSDDGGNQRGQPRWTLVTPDRLFAPLNFPYTPGSTPNGVTITKVEVLDRSLGPVAGYTIDLMEYPTDSGTINEGTSLGSAVVVPNDDTGFGASQTYAVTNISGPLGAPFTIASDSPHGFGIAAAGAFRLYAIRVTFTANRDRW